MSKKTSTVTGNDTQELRAMKAVTKDPAATYIGPAKTGGRWFKNIRSGLLYRVDKVGDEYKVLEESRYSGKGLIAKTRTQKVNKALKDAAKFKHRVGAAGEAYKAPKAPKAAGEGTRASLMLTAKDRGIKYFRVMNRAELEEALKCGVDRLKEIQKMARDRWTSGWKFNKK
jgi:hypothetical protein